MNKQDFYNKHRYFDISFDIKHDEGAFKLTKKDVNKYFFLQLLLPFSRYVTRVKRRKVSNFLDTLEAMYLPPSRTSRPRYCTFPPL